MKEIFIHESEMPKTCRYCPCLNDDRDYETTCNIQDGGEKDGHILVFNIADIDKKCNTCPLKSIEAHDNEVRKEFAEKLQEVFVQYFICDRPFIIKQIDEIAKKMEGNRYERTIYILRNLQLLCRQRTMCLSLWL